MSFADHSPPRNPKPSFSSFAAAFGQFPSNQPLVKKLKEQTKTTSEKIELKEASDVADTINTTDTTKEKQTRDEIYFREIMRKLGSIHTDVAQVKRELAQLKSVVHEIHRSM